MEKKGWVLVDPGSAAGLDGSMAKLLKEVKIGLATIGHQHL